MLNFGVEMQLSALNLGAIKGDCFYATPEFIIYKLGSEPELLTYADAETGKKNKQITERLTNQYYEKYNKVSLAYSGNKKSLYLQAFPRQSYFVYLFNDAEFLTTYKTKEPLRNGLTFSSILLYIVTKSIQSVENILTYLKKNTDAYVLTTSNAESRQGTKTGTRKGTRPRSIDWPFKKMYTLNEKSPQVKFDLGSNEGLDPNSIMFYFSYL